MIQSMVSRAIGRRINTVSAAHQRNSQRSFSSEYPPPQSIADVEATVGGNNNNNNKTMNFSLSGTGPAFFAWMVGFCHGLREVGLVSNESNYLGISGGAMCSVLLAADLDMSEDSDVMMCGQEQSDRCREGKQNLNTFVSNMADDLISEDVLPRLIGTTNVNVAVAWGSLPKAYSSEIVLYDRFTDKHDIINALNAATHLPYISNGKASTTYRGKEVVDAGCTGQMFVPTKNHFQHINILPPLDYVPQKENAFGRFVVGMYAKLTNKARAPVHAHPYMAEDFSLGILGKDDLMIRPLAKDEALSRHRLGYQAFLKWFETKNNSN